MGTGTIRPAPAKAPTVQMPGRAPRYEMATDHGWLQPVLGVDGIAFCPAEGWGRISDVSGLYPVACEASGLRHTAYPDPITHRRMREAFKNAT